RARNSRHFSNNDRHEPARERGEFHLSLEAFTNTVDVDWCDLGIDDHLIISRHHLHHDLSRTNHAAGGVKPYVLNIAVHRRDDTRALEDVGRNLALFDQLLQLTADLLVLGAGTLLVLLLGLQNLEFRLAN